MPQTFNGRVIVTVSMVVVGAIAVDKGCIVLEKQTVLISCQKLKSIGTYFFYIKM